MNNTTQATLKKLTNTVGISGNENYSGITEQIFKIVQKINKNTTKDEYGNIISVVGKGKRKILIDAHLDEVGFMISKISNEKIKLVTIGDINIQKIDNSDVVVLGKNIKGKILQYNSDAVLKINDKNQRGNVAVGDIVSFKRMFSKNGDVISATALDNRVGCTAVIYLINEMIKNKKLDIQIIFTFTAGEEKDQSIIDKISLKHDINFGIIIDAAYAKPINFGTDNMTIPELGDGCAIQYIGTNFVVNKKVINILEKKFNQKGINFQKEIPIPEFGRTNFSKLQQAGKSGCVINIPVKNQHTQESEMNINDFNSACSAIKATINLFEQNKI